MGYHPFKALNIKFTYLKLLFEIGQLIEIIPEAKQKTKINKNKNKNKKTSKVGRGADGQSVCKGKRKCMCCANATCT